MGFEKTQYDKALCGSVAVEIVFYENKTKRDFSSRLKYQTKIQY
jgi:hypothetical protein